MPEAGQIPVQVCYAASPESIHLISLVLPTPATVQDAIEQSGLMSICPELQISTVKTGVFGKLKELSWELHAGDRVEIYRKLLADPMEARRRRARKQAK